MGAKTRGVKQDEAIKLAYMEWLRVPPQDRDRIHESDKNFPRNKVEFADKYHVHRATLNRWEKEPEFKRELANSFLELVSAEEVAKMIAVMKAKALGGNVQAFQAVMKYAGLGADGIDAKISQPELHEEVSAMSDEELLKLVGEADASTD